MSFLKGEFEVEPAFGEKREESLRIAGLKTYFITKVLKPVRTSSILMLLINALDIKPSCIVYVCSHARNINTRIYGHNLIQEVFVEFVLSLLPLHIYSGHI